MVSSIITHSCLILTHTHTHTQTQKHTNVFHHAPKACQPIWLGDNKPNSQQHVSCTPEPGKPKECTSPQLTPSLYLPLSFFSPPPHPSVCLSFSVFSCTTRRHWVKDPLFKASECMLASECVFVCSRCAKETSPTSLWRVCPWDGEKRGREGKWDGKREGV